MFKISPINDADIQKSYAEACGASFKEGFFAYAMTDNDTGALMGFSQFEIEADGGFISDLRPLIGYSDFEAMFILGRATMNFIDLCGVHTCHAAPDAGDERLLRSIGFRNNGTDRLFADMTGMFDGHCDGKTKEI